MNFKYAYCVSDHDDPYDCIYHHGFNKRIAIDIFKKIKTRPGNWVLSVVNRITGVESWLYDPIPEQEITTGVLK